MFTDIYIFDKIKGELSSFEYEPHLLHCKNILIIKNISCNFIITGAIHCNFESIKRSKSEFNPIGKELEIVNDTKTRLKCSRIYTYIYSFNITIIMCSYQYRNLTQDKNM